MNRFLQVLATVLITTIGASAEETAAEPSQSFAETIRSFFAPISTDRASLSRDGKYVAYTFHHGDTAHLMIMNVDRPEVKTPIAISEDREGAAFSRQKILGKIPFFGWATGSRLVFSSDVPEVFAIDGDGKNLKTLIGLNDSTLSGLGRVSVEDFLPTNRNQLLVVVLGQGPGPGSIGLSSYTVDVTTGKKNFIAEEFHPIGHKVLLDRQGQQRFRINPNSREQSFQLVKREAGWKVRGVLGKSLGAEQAAFWQRTPENYFGERAFPVGFDTDPNLLYFASNVGRETYGLYALDLRTDQRTPFAIEDPHFDVVDLDEATAESQLVFDRRTETLAGVRVLGLRPTTRWLEADLARAQEELDARFRSRFVQLIDWDDARTRFLVQVSSLSDPGRYYIYFRTEKKMTEFLRLAPELDVDELNLSKPFEFDTAAGVHLTGYLTQPTNARIDPPPLLIYCHDGPVGRDLPRYNADVQALAAMGFVVAQVNYRGSDGFGRKHRAAGLTTFDRAPVEDFVAVAEWVASRQSIDRKRLALFGVGFGGYLALRALQLEPERFRCAITVNAPADLSSWFSYKQFTMDTPLLTSGITADKDTPSSMSRGLARPAPKPPIDFQSEVRRVLFGADAQRVRDLSPFRHPELIKRPVLFVQNPDNPDLDASVASGLCDALIRQGLPAEYFRIDAEFDQRRPEASVQAFAKIEEFLNLNVYDYGVKVGAPEVVK